MRGGATKTLDRNSFMSVKSSSTPLVVLFLQSTKISFCSDVSIKNGQEDTLTVSCSFQLLW